MYFSPWFETWRTIDSFIIPFIGKIVGSESLPLSIWKADYWQQEYYHVPLHEKDGRL
jgi:hypothetical protein